MSPLGQDTYVRSRLDSAADREHIPTLARHIAQMEDKQVGFLMLSMSLAQRTAYLERNTPPSLGAPAWRRSDSLALWAAEHLMELPAAASFEAFAESGFSADLLTLAPPLPNPGPYVTPIRAA